MEGNRKGMDKSNAKGVFPLVNNTEVYFGGIQGLIRYLENFRSGYQTGQG